MNNFDKFINLVDSVSPSGSTRLFDCMHVAIKNLI